jgi:alkylhydroperoxidase family enzyme
MTSKDLTHDAPVIAFVDAGQLDPEVLALYTRINASVGFVPNSMKTYLHRPKVAAALLDMSLAIYGEDDDSLPMPIQAKLGLVCSSVNGCAYCTTHQCSLLQTPTPHRIGGLSLGLSDDQVSALISGADEGGDARERACFAYARTASRDANAVSDEILSALRAHLTPGQIIQLAAIVGMWKLFNTVHDSLHLPIEAQMEPYRRFLPEPAQP